VTGAATGLAALEARLRQDLEWLELPAKEWVPARSVDGRAVRDVVIVGAGMCGLTASAAMQRLGLRNIIAYDRAPAGREGPWLTYARMRNLRSPKILTGPALGLPALTFRAWYEAQFGRAGWDALGKIPRTVWMDYLVWYRRVLGLPVANEAEVTAVRPFGPDLLELDVTGATGTAQVLARHLVLASGRDGLGGPFVPEITRGIDPRFWAHSADGIDFAALHGRRVGVVGAGASAMDNAATALEAGAARLDLFIRRADIPRINKFTGIGSPGVVHGFQALPDEWKWRFLHYVLAEQTPPPRDSTLRVSMHANAHFHLSSPVLSLAVESDALRLTTPKGEHLLDFLIFATGFQFDLARRPELAGFAPYIRLWKDRYAAPEGLASEELACSPDLAPDYGFQEKQPGACPHLARIHCFNHHATLSHGKLSGDIPAVSEGADRLARGIARRLFVEDREQHYAALQAFATPELLGDEWTDADARSAAA
jgi:cation diffusion facilitator CzcD-associated flavoprotein CzcO